jgi:heme/copper-type cytochrome/quinol oxidase subunit 1
MTVTANPSTTAPAEVASRPLAAPSGVAGVLGSADHKVVGRLWIVASIIGLVAAGIAGALVSVERFDTSEISVVDADWFARVFSFHGIAAAFLFLLPLGIGIATSVVPLQVGSPALAFSRAAAASLWTHVLGAAILIGGYLADGGPFGTDLDGVELYLVGLITLLVAQTIAWVSIATTVVTLRAPGVRMTRVPLFSWSALVAGAVWTLTLPVAVAFSAAALIAVHHGQSLFGETGIYGSVSWTFGQPAVYAFGILVLGFLGEVVPVFASTRGRHTIAMGLVGAFGALAIGSWALPASGTGDAPWLYEVPWVAVSFAVVVPVLGSLGLAGDTLRRGRARVASPLLYAAAATLMLLLGVLAGAVQAIEPIETLVDGEGTSLYGTTWTSGVLHHVALAATIACFGAVTYWAPKLFGRTLAEAPSKLLALGLLAGTAVFALPDLVSGLLGQSARLGGVADNTDSVEALNAVSGIGGAILVLCALGWVLLLLQAIASKAHPGDDPWGGHTLEWATSSPPPFGNFATLPEVTSEAPLYDARHREEANA